MQIFFKPTQTTKKLQIFKYLSTLNFVCYSLSHILTNVKIIRSLSGHYLSKFVSSKTQLFVW